MKLARSSLNVFLLSLICVVFAQGCSNRNTGGTLSQNVNNLGGHALSGFWHHRFDSFSQQRALGSSLIQIDGNGNVVLYDLEYGDFQGNQVGILVQGDFPGEYIVRDVSQLYTRRDVFQHDLYCDHGSGHDLVGELVISLTQANEFQLLRRSQRARRRRARGLEVFQRISQSQAQALLSQSNRDYDQFHGHLVCPQGRSWHLEQVVYDGPSRRGLRRPRLRPRRGYEVPSFTWAGDFQIHTPLEIRFDHNLSFELNAGMYASARQYRYNYATSEIWMDLSVQGGRRSRRGQMTRGKYVQVDNNRMEIHFQLGGRLARYVYTR